MLKNECWLLIQNECLLRKKSAELPIFTIEEMNYFQHVLSNQQQLLIENQTIIFCGSVEKNFLPPDFVEAIPLKKAFAELDLYWQTLTSKARTILNWNKTHQYCGHCGQPTIQPNLTIFERVCSQCGLTFYPRISPSIIVRIQKNDSILMARSYHFPKGVYGLIAGFVEVGETLEEAVYREVKEETNLEINNLCYYGSQFWPFPDSLMIAFTADYAKGELVFDKKEIEDGDWYRYDQMPGKPSSSVSISRKLIEDFINQQTLR